MSIIINIGKEVCLSENDCQSQFEASYKILQF